MKPARIWYLSCEAYKRRWYFVAKLLKFVNFFCFKAILPFQADIQSDLFLGHYGLGIVVHPNVRIGRRVIIWQHVTLASETQVGSQYRISIGNDVMIGAGAIIIAREDKGLVIGDGARVGAGSVVTRDVEPGQTVIGSPARPVKSKSSSFPAPPE